MLTTQSGLAELAKKADYRSLEDRWLSSLEQASQQREDLLATLEILTKNGKGELAAALGWSWLAAQKERSEPADVLNLGREIMLRCGDSTEMRQEILSLYREVHANRPEIQKLIDASGLSGDKSPRRALRTLEICLNLQVGDMLLSHSDERAAEVLSIDADVPEYTIFSRRGEDTLDPDTLALRYDHVGTNDFRALAQLHPERITDLLDSDPATLVTGLLHSHHGQLDSDELKQALVPKYLAAGKWSSWWSKARAALNRSPNVVLGGRNPVVITYHHRERTLDDEILPQWMAADTPVKRLAAVEAYLREAKARGTSPTPQMLARMHADLVKRVNAARRGSPSEALLEAIVLDRLAEAGVLAVEQAGPLRDILRENTDFVSLLEPIEDNRFYLRAIETIRELYPERWPDIYIEMLPHASVEGCEFMAAALQEAGLGERLRAVAEQALTDFGKYLDAVCWLWRGKIGSSILPIPPREMLNRIFDHLGQVTRSDYVVPKTLRDTRTKIRAALSAANYAAYRQVIEGMESGLASTIRTTIERLEGLGHVVHGNLIKIINHTHPELSAQRGPRVTIDPWQDDTVIYCTQKGYERRKGEVDHLTKVKIPENARAIGEAASHGDLSENSEYKFALEERDLLQARLMNMQGEISLAHILTPGEISINEISIGTKATLVSPAGDRREVTILGPFESDMEQAVYNYRAPLAGKLRGLRVNDTVRLDLGAGEQEYQVLEIANAVAR
jgi:transcription elongation factor GreA